MNQSAFLHHRPRALLSALLALLLTLPLPAQEKRTVVCAEMEGYKQDKVLFECVQTPFVRAECDSCTHKEHHFAFLADRPLMIMINDRTPAFLMPGDSLHASIFYEGRVVMVTYSGTAEAVNAANLICDAENVRRQMRYNLQLMGCAALKIQPKARITDSFTLLSRIERMMQVAKLRVAPEAIAYLRAATEATVYYSLMEYPPLYARIHDIPIEEQGIGDYYSLMDGYQILTDEVSLSCPEYVVMLMRYMVYDKERSAHLRGEKYRQPQTLETMYEELADYFDGPTREAVLFRLICNFIREGKEKERAAPLIKDFREKYNPDPRYLDIIRYLLP